MRLGQYKSQWQKDYIAMEKHKRLKEAQNHVKERGNFGGVRYPFE